MKMESQVVEITASANQGAAAIKTAIDAVLSQGQGWILVQVANVGAKVYAVFTRVLVN